MENKSKRILVTGGTGFLGSYLLRFLVQHGYTNIRAIKRKNSSLDLVGDIANQIDWVEGELTDWFFLSDCFEDIDWVFHVAALVSFDARDYKDMQLINVRVTADLVNLSLDNHIKKFCFVSSIAALGRSKVGETLDESAVWKHSPYNSRYGMSKFLGEQEVWRGMAEGLSAVIVNPGMILGSGRWNEGTSRFFSLIDNGFPFIPNGAATWVDVRDVVSAMYQLMISDIHSERFILVAGIQSYNDFFKTAASALGKKISWIALPSFIQSLILPFAWLVARLSGNRPFITRESLRLSKNSFFYKTDKSLTIPGFNKYLTVHQSILDTVSAYQQEKKNNIFSPLNF
ncbi:MAG: NAD-dependent epimerase/dehydratase family protein [Bacteroidetes bacterium]|nr:NAD-dependent epimerase/dehydratase family protein [Bacteroidota bacterium]